MRNDVLIGVTVSALIHFGVFFGDRLFPTTALPVKPANTAPVVKLMEMPKLDLEEPEKIETTEELPKSIEVPPPSQVDVPQIVTDTSFVQRLQPPPPEDLKPSANMVTIPENRNPTGLRNVTIFDPASLDQQPVARVTAPPQYPFDQRRNGTTGEVLVDFIVDSNGNVLNAFALKSSQREFETPAVQAVSKWKFKPGRRGAHAVNTHMQVPIVFNLNND